MANQIAFTSDRIAKLKCPEGKSQVIYWDTNNKGYLGIRITSNQVRAYIFQTRLHGQTIRLTIGRPPAMSIGEAQTEAMRLKVLTDQGTDPREIKAEKTAQSIAKKQKGKQALIIWDEYIKDRAKHWGVRHKQSHDVMVREGGKKITRGLKKGMDPIQADGILRALLSQPLDEITREKVIKWLSKQAKDRPTYARLGLALLRAFITWAGDHPEYKALVNADACERLTKELPAPSAKNDCLQTEQLKIWFDSVHKIGNPVISAYLQMLLLTGARRNELTALKWKDVDMQWHVATIKDKANKTAKKTRQIPLTPYAEFLIDSLPRRNEYVFSSPLAKGRHITEPRIAHNQALKAGGLPNLTIHGLRRSFGTLAEWVECPTGISAQIMGHTPSATAEKHYRVRPIDLLRKWHIQIENYILEQAGIPIPKPEAGDKRLKVVNSN
jgi:integrase